MNLDFHLQGRQPELDGDEAGQPLEWRGLHARLAAAYAARAVLTDVLQPEIPVDGGSFDRCSARRLSLYGTGQGRELDGVNPTALANGNSGRDNDAAATTTHVDGDRG